MDKAHVLIVEDDEVNRKLLSEMVEDWGYSATAIASGKDLWKTLEAKTPNVVLLDLFLADGDGREVLKSLHRLRREIPVIMVTGKATVDNAVECMQLGAYQFLEKPYRAEQLQFHLRNAVELNELARKYSSLRDTIESADHFENMIGTSEEMQTIYHIIRNVSQSDASVFITGESGTGKELVARAIHSRSRRADRSFEPVNCAAIPRELLESEMFGHEKGSFTGAYTKRVGSCERADGGTLFLDEVCEMPPELQVKMLRFLQDRTFRRVGGNELTRVDVRVIAATNRNPLDEIAAGRLREDLYYRLMVVPIEVPPLRERREDIFLLATHFLDIFARKNGKAFAEISPEALRALVRYPWQGNVRELENVIENVVVLNNDTAVKPDHLPERIRTYTPPEGEADNEIVVEVERIKAEMDAILPMAEVEKRAIANALQVTKGNIPAAAKKLKLGQATIYRKIKAYKIKV
ncbi:MAG: sigma-54-dependent Fis family transcriptional regulator [Verrucomicrobia bacterium]|nr:sigma-54-dependent Fis family transcriptional regulator [Verrucomicrobiota bacterium]